MSKWANVGQVDRVLRFVLAAVLLAIGVLDNPIVSGGTTKIIIGIFAVVPLLTGLFRYCPLYTLIGINTCSKQKS
ncbi:YgaP family membrane protein [Geopsychrobacter electrodiphilus]|uniref:YgaP family membrane protein n=1 Tax=Geopsychrobacter electrodiphilus TaxID=225196 RepID=UPI0003686844|nr:DUF2892 domain-containing protein [Geopsychrobacter electrodiphilus]